jgi:hypothetical protein
VGVLALLAGRRKLSKDDCKQKRERTSPELGFSPGNQEAGQNLQAKFVGQRSLDERSIRCEEHLTLKLVHVFVYSDAFLDFPLIVFLEVRNDGRGQVHPIL